MYLISLIFLGGHSRLKGEEMDQSVIPPGAKYPSLILPGGNSGQGDNVGCDTGNTNTLDPFKVRMIRKNIN